MPTVWRLAADFLSKSMPYGVSQSLSQSLSPSSKRQPDDVSQRFLLPWKHEVWCVAEPLAFTETQTVWRLAEPFAFSETQAVWRPAGLLTMPLIFCRNASCRVSRRACPRATRLLSKRKAIWRLAEPLAEPLTGPLAFRRNASRMAPRRASHRASRLLLKRKPYGVSRSLSPFIETPTGWCLAQPLAF